MSLPALVPVLREVQHHLALQAEVSDQELLRRFVEHQEEAAFATLVGRHGGMVVGVCHRILGEVHDVEDAFQATFLVLARRARSLRNGQALACWLHEVAYHIALKARARHSRERAIPSPRSEVDPADPVAEASQGEVRLLVEEELRALPEKYQAPLILCYLEGKTHEQAARELGCPLGSMSWRLHKGRELLRTRLQRLGLSPSVALMGQADWLPAHHSLSPALVRTTTQTAMRSIPIPEGVRVLADGVIKEMMMPRSMLALVLLLSSALVLGGLGLLSLPAQDPPAPASSTAPVNPVDPDQPAVGEKKKEVNPTEALPAGARARLGSMKLRHENEVLCVTFSPDGKTLLSTAMNGKLKMWDVASGNLLREKYGPGGTGESVLFSGDGKYYYTAGSNVPDQNEVATLHRGRWYLGSNTGMDALALSADGKTLASGNKKGTVYVWDVTSKQLLHTLGGPAGVITSMAFAPDGKSLTVGLRDKPVLSRWEMPSGKTLEPIKGEAGVNVIAYSADGETLACACQDGTVALWNVRNRTFSRLGNAKKPVLSLAWSPDDKLLASADEAGLVSLWDPARGKRVRSVPHPRPVRDVAFSPDGKLLAWPVGNLIHFYEVANWKQREEVAGHTTRLQDLAFSPDGKVLASGAFKDPALRLWDVTTGKELHRLVDGKGGVFTCLFSPDGKTLVASPFSGGFDPDLRLWDPATGKLKGKLAGPTSMVTCLAYSPDGKWLASGESVRILRLWDMASQKQIRQWSGPVPGQRWTGPNTLTFTPEGNQLISTGHGEPICVWDPQTGKLERTFEGGAMRVKSVALSPSGRTLATSTSTSYFLVWERATGKQITRIGKHDSKIFDLAVSPDGRRIASGSGDRTVRIWDLASGKEIQRFSGGSVVSTLAYSPDGTTLAVGMWDGTILLYDVSPPEKPEPDHLTGTQLQELWTDLLAHDPGKAYRAVWALRSAPQQAIPFLREQLTSPARTDDARVARLIAQLDDDQFVVRNRATQALKEMGPVADEALRRALRETKSVEVRIRIRRLLAGRGESGYPVQRLRTLRALDVLEQVGGKDAQEALAELSKKGGTAWLRSEAGQGLKRLEARGNEGRWR